ncbi:hypothetical protein WJX74_002277 [Apatococcus lobatus]|uniref:beta-aspartyl-peptidase n=1 Tax=Apatococcus lobatus TaxID=904363 RepID=A0AAW1RY72_9CHLO
MARKTVALLSVIPLLGVSFTEARNFVPVVINTWPFTEATSTAWQALEQGKASLDAVEEGCERCEQLQCDGTVGFGGSPDEDGQTTLDAMIMNGTSMEVGAVCDLQDVKEAVLTARLVMQHTHHSMLAGLAAANFAVQMGLTPANLTTDASSRLHADWSGRPTSASPTSGRM